MEDAKVALSTELKLESSSLNQTMKRNNNRSFRINNESTERALFTDPDDSNIQNALTNLKKWDTKVRNDFLRSMPDFRPCPHCAKLKDAGSTTQSSAGNTTSTSTKEDTTNEENVVLNGGGFITPECLSPIKEERELYAERIMGFAGPTAVQIVLVGYAIYYLVCSRRYSIDIDPSNQPMSRMTVTLQILKALLPGLLVPILPHTIRLFLSHHAKQTILQPLPVTCPNCHNSFHLNASSEFNLAETFTPNASESATQSWKKDYTRPCPKCASPIQKEGGCNHIRCGKCHTNFCWACMQSKSKCKAYQCINGAPYGNAFGDGSLGAIAVGLANQEQRMGRRNNLMGYIDFVEGEARRNLEWSVMRGNVGRIVGMYVVLNLVGDYNVVFGERLVSLVWIIVKCVGIVMIGALIVLCMAGLYWVGFGHRSFELDHQRQNGAQRHNVEGQRGMLQTINRPRTRRGGTAGLNFRTEEEMISEAIARSITEQ